MSTTVYGPTFQPSSSTCKVRSMCVYDVTSSNTQTTISGTIYLQHSGGAYDYPSTYNICARIGLYTGSGAPPTATATTVSGTYYVGACSSVTSTDYYNIASAASHSSWTSVKSKSFSIVISKTTSAQTKYFMYGMTQSILSSTYVSYGGYKSVSIPAITSYAVKYDANGGSGAPAQQTKYYGTALTLSSTKPTRTNYVFRYWYTTKAGTGGTSYAPGASYTANAALTLYAQWYAPYTVTYNANGGTGGPTTQTKIYNTNLTLTTSQPTRSGYVFVKWNTKSDGTGTSYNSGATYSSNANVTLYAIWAAVPTISSLTAVRCDANGNQDDEGTYANITCVWTCAANATASGTFTPQSGGGSTSFSFSSGASGSGTVTSTAKIGGGNLDTDMQYTVSVTVSCTSSGVTKTATRNVILTRAFFVMDWKAGGQAVGIGRAAPEIGLEVGYKAVFDDAVNFLTSIIVENAGGVLLSDPIMDATYNTTISEQRSKSTIIRDKKNQTVAQFVGRQLATGEKRALMEAHGYNSNGDSVWASIFTQVDKAGTKSALFQSGTVTVQDGNGYLKTSAMDRDGANPSSDQVSNSFRCVDKDGERMSQINVTRRTTGRIDTILAAYNENSSGTEVSNSIRISIDKDGTREYGVTDPAAFCSALHVGDYVTNSASDVSTATAKYKDLFNFTLAAGTWLVFVTMEFATNANGRRVAMLNTTAGGNGISLQWRSTETGVSGGPTRAKLAGVLRPSSSTKYYVTGWQNSGGNLNLTAVAQAVRIK